MTCRCIEELDERLKAKNLKLGASSMGFRMPKFELMLSLPLEWIDRSKAPKGKLKSPPRMFVSYCPFCGNPVDPKDLGGQG